MQLCQILKALSKHIKGKEKIRDILYKYKSRMPENDFWLLEYVFLEQLSPENIQNKFGMAGSTFYQAKKNALGKLEVLLTDKEFKELFYLA